MRCAKRSQANYARHLAAALLAIVNLTFAACDSRGTPTSPRTDTAPGVHQEPAKPAIPTSSLVTISGVVINHTPEGQFPAAGVALLMRWGAGTTFEFRGATSDANGRFLLADVPGGAISIAAAPNSGFYSPCPAGSDVVSTSSSFDVHVASATVLSTIGSVDLPYRFNIWVAGQVFEQTDNGAKPIAGALVNFEGNGSDPAMGSSTLTDSLGRYVMCPPLPGTGTDTSAPITATKDGFRSATRTAFLGWDYDGMDIALARNH